eukprot:11822202-Alexandrium_andersonii.AAC.1
MCIRDRHLRLSPLLRDSARRLRQVAAQGEDSRGRHGRRRQRRVSAGRARREDSAPLAALR